MDGVGRVAVAVITKRAVELTCDHWQHKICEVVVGRGLNRGPCTRSHQVSACWQARQSSCKQACLLHQAVKAARSTLWLHQSPVTLIILIIAMNINVIFACFLHLPRDNTANIELRITEAVYVDDSCIPLCTHSAMLFGLW